MGDDEAGKPFWNYVKPNRTVLSAQEIADKEGVSQQAMRWALRRLTETGRVVPRFTPQCRHCMTVVGEYADAEAIPEDVRCPTCGQNSHVSELIPRMGYAVVEDD